MQHPAFLKNQNAAPCIPEKKSFGTAPERNKYHCEYLQIETTLLMSICRCSATKINVCGWWSIVHVVVNCAGGGQLCESLLDILLMIQVNISYQN